MDWQQVVSLALVIAAAGFLILTRLRTDSSTVCGQGCACPREETTPAHTTPPAPLGPS